MHTDRRINRLILALCFFFGVHECSSAAQFCFAGLITTLDGKRIEGAVAVESKSALLVTPKSGPPARVELTNLLEAQMDVSSGDSAMTRGIVMTDGTALAAATFRRADADTIKLVPAMMNAEVSIKAVRVARVVFGEMSPDLLSRVPGGATGVLLESGDFVEGEFVGLENGKIKISSVLFGIQSFDAGRPARAVILRDAKPPSGEVVVRLVDGSVLPAAAVALDRAATQIEKTVVGTISVPFDQIANLSAGGERVVSLASLKPTGSTTSTPRIEPVRLIGACRSTAAAIQQSSRGELSFNLGGNYESFITEVGVPAALVPSQRVRIVVLGDGKELFRSDERTSVDDALSVTFSVKGVSTLVLRVETGSVDTTVAWLDPILVKAHR